MAHRAYTVAEWHYTYYHVPTHTFHKGISRRYTRLQFLEQLAVWNAKAVGVWQYWEG